MTSFFDQVYRYLTIG